MELRWQPGANGGGGGTVLSGEAASDAGLDVTQGVLRDVV